MLISDGLNVKGSFQLFPHGGREMGGAYLTWLNFTLAALQDFSIYKSFHSKVIFRCWAAFRLGHHVNKEVAPSLLLIYFYEKRGGNQVFAGGGGRGRFQLLTCTRLRARTQAPAAFTTLPGSTNAQTCCVSMRGMLRQQEEPALHTGSLFHAGCIIHFTGGQEASPALKIHRRV